jgi:FlaA1/EpsC-like NDP-sugar epimerase
MVRRGGKLLLDGGLAALAWCLACGLLRPEPAPARGALLFAGLAMAVNAAFGLTGQHYRLVGLSEASALLRGSLTIAVAGLGFCALHGAARFGVAGADIFLPASLLTGGLWFGLRMLAMHLHHRRFRPRRAGRPGSERTLIVGAGRAGMLLAEALREHPKLSYQVLGFVDDAMEKQGVRVGGVPVLGPTRLLDTFIREQRATMVILGMAGAPGARIRELSRRLQAHGVRVKTVPGILELVGDHPWKPEVRDIAIEDLLRREAVELDTGAIRQAVEGTVTLITGAGGSIGGELCRRVAGFRPSCLVLVGRGENSLWEIERDLRRLFPAQDLAVALCDIRNSGRLHQVFDTWRPQVVFHAAAHKHVPYLEQNPEEGIGNNIFGTRNVLEAALAAATRIVVNVSTDKAVNPVNVLGVTKRIGEHLVTRAASEAAPGCRFVSVRFGNVLGTDGHGPAQRHKVEAMGLGPCFDQMVFTGDFARNLHKPSPFPFQLACGRLGVPPARCAYVGDNPACDFKGPRSLGMLTVGVGTGPFARLAAAQGQAPHLRVDLLEDLTGLLACDPVRGAP